MAGISIGPLSIDIDDIKNAVNKIRQIIDANEAEGRSVELHQKAQQCFEQGAYEASIRLCDKALKSTSLNEDLLKGFHFIKGMALFFSDRNEKAILSFNLALEIDPLYIDAWNYEGIALYYLGKYDEAVKDFDTAIKIKPQNVDFAENKSIAVYYGYTLCQLERYEDAIVCFEKALKLNQNNVYALTGKGFALEKLNKLNDSWESYKKAIEQDLKNADAWNGLGNIFLIHGLEFDNQGKSKEALECYNSALGAKDSAIETNPNLWYVWNDKSLVLKAMHREGEAEIALAKANELRHAG